MLEAPQGTIFAHGLVFIDGKIAVGHEHCVGRVIVLAVKPLELFVGELGYDLWVTAAVVVVGQGRKQLALQRLREL